ncbi:ScbR family autoregulator-binding transcription factor [Streptomyces pacificus]|uniref:TetR/AcrR family transcriptional regulator n=1 Tax=Streptomyces pacificus TaxID=2705029 RepID=A0A6A0AP27_9ACTN|nr:ScbR family autoregulator-binding transcription factor [Streptomyces pacificus]GFH34729.1 TetR/AcrR family transcriptional regulator [Streptomyces pacificus]
MQDRAAKTRRQLIRAAAEAFDRAGFAGSSIWQICALAGVSQGALHFHFGNKQGLGGAVEATAAGILRCVTAPDPARHPSPLQLLVDTSHALASRIACDQVLRAGFGLAHDPAWSGETSLWLLWRDWVRGLLTVARQEGGLAPRIDLDDAVSAVTAMMAGVEGLGRDRGYGGPSTRSVTPFWRLVLPQLSAESLRGRIDAAGSRSAGPGEPPLGEWPFDDRPAPDACGAPSVWGVCSVPGGELSGSGSQA